MEVSEETKKIIQESKNVYIIPEEGNSEAISSALALFYALKSLNKNINFLLEKFPEKLNFLIPSPDFISYPRNFVLSIPKHAADISQIYYEKSDEAFKIHLTLDKGSIKKDNISFYYSEARPDLIITIGIKNYQEQLEKMDSFGFLLSAPILNIDNHLENNLNFGKINLVEQKSVSEIIFDLIKALGDSQISKEMAECLLSGLIIFSDNFTNYKTTSEILEIASILMRQGANRDKIIKELYKTEQDRQELFQKMFNS
jgi:nanoRNase/pAp phosphatase (c-di-AMP/oligoRNAs hydrolase)